MLLCRYHKSINLALFRSRLLASANPAMKPEPGAESASVGFPRRSTRHNRYTAAAISSFIQAEEEDPAEPLPRGQRGRSRRNVRAAAESDDDFQPEYNDSAESEGDPDESGVDFVITNEAPGVPSRRSGSSKVSFFTTPFSFMH